MSVAVVETQPPKLEKKPVKFSNLLLGAGLNLFEVRYTIPYHIPACPHADCPDSDNRDWTGQMGDGNTADGMIR